MHIYGGSWVGATMTPEGQDNLKGQACLGCKRNGLLLGPQYAPKVRIDFITKELRYLVL
jgi:hypothetical protein